MSSTGTPRRQQPLLAWGDVVEDYLPNGKVGDCLSTTAHSLTAIIGIGILALPYAISYLGWIAGPILLFVFYLCTVLSNYLLLSIYQLHGRTHSTYHMAVRDIMESRRYAMAVSSLQLFTFFLVMIAFEITGGSAIQNISARACEYQGKTEEEIYHDGSCLGSGAGGVWQAILIFTALQWLISIVVKTLSGSTLMSVGGMVCAVIYSLVAIIISFTNIPSTGAAGSMGGVMYSTADKVFGVFNALGQIASAYGLAMILLEIMDTLRQPPPPVKTMIKTTWISLSVCLVLYMLVGCGGYASQGDGVPSNILDAFDGPGWAMILANSALLINMIASYQIFAQTLFDTVESWIKYYIDQRRLRKLGLVDDGKGKGEGKGEGKLDPVEEGRNGEDGEDGANDDVIGVTSSVFAFDVRSEAELRRRQTQRQPQHGSEDLLDVKYSRLFVQVPSMEPKRTSVIVEYATAKRTIQSGWTNENVLSNVDGVFLPLWIRVLDRSIIVLLIALIACIMPFFGAFVGLIGTCTYWPLAIALPIQMFRKSFHVSRVFGLTLTVVYWSFLVVTMVSLVGAVRSIVVGFSTYKIFGS